VGGERGVPEPERLARLYFETARAGDVLALRELLHPDVEITLKTRGGELLRGRDEVARFVSETADAHTVFETADEQYHVVDEDRVIVEGRMRWMDEERVLHDDPVTWALEFREGLLLRSTPARSFDEAQEALGGAPEAREE
jgi:ketosteroid isomerase-like protein